MLPFETSEAERLLFNLVHDLRQPLGTIQTSAYLLGMMMAGTPAQAQEQVQIIQRQTALAALLLHEFAAVVVRQRAEAENLEVTNSETALVT
jgi:signal transduction histidine kinase